MSKNQTVEKNVENQYIFKYPLDGKNTEGKGVCTRQDIIVL